MIKNVLEFFGLASLWVTHMLVCWQRSGVSSRSMPSDSPDLSRHVLHLWQPECKVQMCAFPNRKSKPFPASSFYSQEYIPTSDCPGTHFPLHKPITEILMHFFHVLFTQKLFSASAWRRFWGGWLPELLSTCNGKIPKNPVCSFSAVPGLASVGPISTQSFPSYRFLVSLSLHQLFISLYLPFFVRGLSFSPAAFSHPPSYSSLSPAPLSLPHSSCSHWSSPAALPPHPANSLHALNTTV